MGTVFVPEIIPLPDLSQQEPQYRSSVETIEKRKIIDYVLVYEKENGHSIQIHDFLIHVKKLGLMLEPDVTVENLTVNKEESRFSDFVCYKQKVKAPELLVIKIHAPFEILSQGAQKMKLKMPLVAKYKKSETTYTMKLLECFKMADRTEYCSIPYVFEQGHLFEGFENKDTFFRPALRSLIVHHILTHIEMKAEYSGDREMTGTVSALPYLLMKNIINSAFTLHDNIQFNNKGDSDLTSHTKSSDLLIDWRKLEMLWVKRFHIFLPLWRIRNYFGEQISFYFALMETLLITLVVPAFFGMGVFLYGVYISVSCYKANQALNEFLHGYSCNTTCSSPNQISTVAEEAIEKIRNACDNVGAKKGMIEKLLNSTCATKQENCTFEMPPDGIVSIIKPTFDNFATPWLGLVICLWGTIFLEVWKRKRSKLAYEWNVEKFEDDELTRPQFYGIGSRENPVTGEREPYYPSFTQRLKMLLSFSVAMLMMGCVVISIMAIIIYNSWARITASSSNSVSNFFLTTIVTSILNALSIAMLGKMYQKIAVLMTDWENYRTQTHYNDALLLKLFAFEFANNYAPLFYLAFFRKSHKHLFNSFGLPHLDDSCREMNTCMSELSFQILILMISKPLPKVLKDVIQPWLKNLFNRRKKYKEESLLLLNSGTSLDTDILGEYMKPNPGDFTLEEYNEKVIQYGYQMLFAISFPLGSLVFFITILCDVNVDAMRLMKVYKRPIAFMAQDIGHWFTILDMINQIAVVTNACIIAFTAEFGKERPLYQQLALILVFEHTVFLVKYLLATFIPDVSQDIKVAIRREEYQREKANRKNHLTQSPAKIANSTVK